MNFNAVAVAVVVAVVAAVIAVAIVGKTAVGCW